jgi:hypothetical protein
MEESAEDLHPGSFIPYPLNRRQSGEEHIKAYLPKTKNSMV